MSHDHNDPHVCPDCGREIEFMEVPVDHVKAIVTMMRVMYAALHVDAPEAEDGFEQALIVELNGREFNITADVGEMIDILTEAVDAYTAEEASDASPVAEA